MSKKDNKKAALVMAKPQSKSGLGNVYRESTKAVTDIAGAVSTTAEALNILAHAGVNLAKVAQMHSEHYLLTTELELNAEIEKLRKALGK